MSVIFIVHTTTKEDMVKAFEQVHDDLSWLFPGEVNRHYDNTLITMKNGINISFRCGTNPDKLAGLWPNYYYTDNDEVADMLVQGACKVNGKRLDRLDYIAQIVLFYMDMFEDIDDWLEDRIGKE